jgi:hypothetical protein
MEGCSMLLTSLLPCSALKPDPLVVCTNLVVASPPANSLQQVG